MAKYAGVDYIDFDSQLNDEEKLVRQTAREFVENEIIPIIETHSREATFPMHLVPQLGQLGFFGANLHGYGCAGMSSVAYGLMTQELERGDSGIRSFVSVQSALVMYPIHSFGSEEQKNRCGSRAVLSPMSPWSGRNAKTKKSAASWWKRARPASRPGTSTASGRCALRSRAAWRSRIARFPKRTCSPASPASKARSAA